jgi:general nucleoside transport system permease protein
VIRLEARTVPSRWMAALSPLVALAITVLVAAALFQSLGKDPLVGLRVFFLKPYDGVQALTELGLKATPLILCALGLSLCYRSNVWNIGAEGQYLMGAVTGGGLALWFTASQIEVSRWVFFPLLLLAGALGGAAWAAVVAFLRDRFHANEILVSLMLVYVADYFLKWLVFGPWKDPNGFNFPQTMSFAAWTEVPRLIGRLRLNWGFLVALVAAFTTWVFMFRTYSGVQLQVGGPAPLAARYAGFSARKALYAVLLTSGGLAGVAGAVEAAGPMGQLTAHVASGYGFTAIIVAFVGRLHPLGVVLGSVLLSAFLVGGEQSQTPPIGLPSAMSGVFQGVLLFSLLACDTLIQYRVRWSRVR